MSFSMNYFLLITFVALNAHYQTLRWLFGIGYAIKLSVTVFIHNAPRPILLQRLLGI